MTVEGKTLTQIADEANELACITRALWLLQGHPGFGAAEANGDPLDQRAVDWLATQADQRAAALKANINVLREG